MGIIDKASADYLHAVDAETEAREQELIDPKDDSAYEGARGGLRHGARKKPEEVQYFLQQNTLSMLERLHNIASDNLYSRLTNGERVKTPVPPGVQLAAITDFLDRAIGKPKTQVDITSGDRPIIIDPILMSEPLVQMPAKTSQEAIGSIAPIEPIDSIDTVVESIQEAPSKL